MKHLKRLIKLIIITALLSLTVILISNELVKKSTANKTYNSITEIPHNKVGMMLGTSKYIANGWINLYYKNRIDATVALFHAGKIDFVLISGDNSTMNYDEPTTIQKDLIAQGIPENKIYLDYAGFRTLDSIVRSKEIFGQTNITVISQQFHNERAIYIANKKGINAIGFNANDISLKYGFRTYLREKLARVKMMLDLTLNKKPKFLGEKIIIE